MKRQGTALLLCTAMLSALLVTGAAAEAAPAPVLQDGGTTGENGAVLTKTAAYRGENVWDITLEAYVTGERVTVEESLPTDLVLVLDQSGSMGDAMEVQEKRQYQAVTELIYNPFAQQYYAKADGAYFEAKWEITGSESIGFISVPTFEWCYYDAAGVRHGLNPKRTMLGGSDQFYKMVVSGTQKTKTQVLKEAVDAFLDEVAATGAAHRVAIVGFASESGYGDNTELFRGGSSVVYGKLNAAEYQTAFQQAGTQEGLAALKASVALLAHEGATRADLGMNMAEQIFANNPVEAGTRSRAVILFTDGVPTAASEFDNTVANAAIASSHSIKSAYGAKVYTIGVMDDADPADTTGKVNRFLGGVSSNYPGATALDALGARVDSAQQYYFAAQEAARLTAIFQSISQSIGGAANTVLDASTVVRDGISPVFDLPAGATAQDVRITTAAYLGENQWAEPVPGDSGIKAAVQDKTVEVTGFDFSANWCGTDNGSSRGKKLRITFPVTRAAGFFGGSDVPTNTADSGLYLGDTAIGSFYQPHVDVPLQYALKAQDQWVYLGQTADLHDDLLLQPETINGVNNAYVQIEYVLRDAAGAQAAVWTLPAGADTRESSCPQIQWSTACPEGVIQPEETRAYTLSCRVTATRESWQAACEFQVKVRFCTLSIEKTGGAETESYLFHVEGDNGRSFLVAVQGNGIVTCGKLPIGCYTVTENSDWSWRYTAQSKTAELKPTPEGDHARVTLVNQRTDSRWLSGDSAAVNQFRVLPMEA